MATVRLDTVDRGRLHCCLYQRARSYNGQETRREDLFSVGSPTANWKLLCRIVWPSDKRKTSLTEVT
jgi:hypothetical protein